MSLSTSPYHNLIVAEAQFRNLPAWNGVPSSVWMEAIALHESSGNPNAQHMDRPGWLDTSYGLFQIEGRTAQAMLPGLLCGDILFDPSVSTGLAGKILQQLVHQYNGNVDQVIAAYNGGNWGAQKKHDDTYNDQVYLDFIKASCKQVDIYYQFPKI